MNEVHAMLGNVCLSLIYFMIKCEQECEQCHANIKVNIQLVQVQETEIRLDC